MNNLGIALIFIVYVQYAYSATIKCTVNCDKANSGSSPAASFPSGNLMSAPVIDGPSDFVGSNGPPAGPPIDTGPRYKEVRKTPKRGFAPLPPHIQACIDGKGGKNCHRYARLNTAANRRRFLIKNRSNSRKTKIRFIQKEEDRSKSSAKQGQMSSKKLKENAETSISDNVNSLVNSLVKALDTGKDVKLSVKSGKRTTKDDNSSKSESNISSRQSNSSTAVVSFSPSKTSSSDKSSKHSQDERSRDSDKLKISMFSGKKRERDGSDSVTISGNLPSASKTQASIARKRLSKNISGSSRSGSSTTQTLSGSERASSPSRITSTAGRASSLSGMTATTRRAPTFSGMTSAGERTSSLSGMTATTRRAPSFSGMTTAGGRASSVSGLKSATGRASSVSGLKSAAGRASSVSGLKSATGRAPSVSGFKSATGRASSVSGLKSAAGRASSVSGLKSATGRASSVSGLKSAAGRASSVSGLKSATGRASSVSGLKSAAGRAPSVSGMTSAPGRAPSVSGMTSAPGRALSMSGITSAAGRVPSVSRTTSVAGKASSVSGMTSTAGRAPSVSGITPAAGRASSLSGMTSPVGGASSRSGMSSVSADSPNSKYVSDQSSGSGSRLNKMSMNMVPRGNTNIDKSSVGKFQSAISDIQTYVDKHNEDGSKGMNQDDSKGFNQDKNKIQKLEFEHKQNEVSVQDPHDKQTMQKIEIEIKQVEVSKSDEHKSTGRNKFREEDGSKGQNQDGSQGKNQDGSQGINQDQDKTKSSWVIIGHSTNTGGASQKLDMSPSSATGSPQPKQPSVGINIDAGMKGVNPNIRNTAINLQLRNQQTLANQIKSQRHSQSFRNAAVNLQLKNQQTLANQMRLPRPLKRLSRPSKPTKSISIPVQGTASSSAHTTAGSTNREILAALNSAARAQSIKQYKPLIQQPLVSEVDTKRPRPAFLDDISGTSPKEWNILKPSLPSKSLTQHGAPGTGLQGCSCAQATLKTPKPQLIQATAKLAIVGDRNVLIAKMPRAKIVDADGMGDFHLEFPNLIIQPTLTEKIASPSELFGMNMNTGTGSTDDSDILVVALLPKGSKLGSKMFKNSKKDLQFNNLFDADIGTQVSEISVNTPSDTNLGKQVSDLSVNKPSYTNLVKQVSGLTVNKPSYTNLVKQVSDITINKPSDDTNIGTQVNDVSINKPSDTNKDAKITVDTSKDDGKLKIKVQAENVKDSTISTIKDNLSKIKSDKISVDTSKDDGKLEIKIKADSEKTDVNANINVVKTAQSNINNKDNSNLKLANVQNVKALGGQIKSEKYSNSVASNFLTKKESTDSISTPGKQNIILSEAKVLPAKLVTQIKIEKSNDDGKLKYKIKTDTGRDDNKAITAISTQGKQAVILSEAKGLPAKPVTQIKIEKSNDDGKLKYKIKTDTGRDDNKAITAISTQGKQAAILSEAKVLPAKPVTQINIEKSKDDGKLKYKIKTETGYGDNKAKTNIKLTIDKYGRVLPDIEVKKQFRDRSVSVERSSFVHSGKHAKSNQITVAGKHTDRSSKREEDGDNTYTIKQGKGTTLSTGTASVNIGSDSAKTTKIAEAVKALTALQKLQAKNQALAAGSIRSKPTLPDTTYKIPVNGGSLNTLSEKLSKQIKLKLKTDDVDVLSRNRLLSAVLAKQPSLTKVASSATVAAAASPNLEALCLLYLGAFIDSIGYAPFPGKCNKLVQCFYLGGKLQTVARDCPAGMFWDQKQLLCRPPDDVICLEDQCLIHGTNHYRRDGGCNCFYKCVEGISVPSCCPKGYRYDDDKECVRASGRDLCDDECETPSILTRQLTQTSCPSLPDPMNRYGYLAPQYGGLRIRACPSGTIYSENQCRCKSNMNGNGGLRGSARKQFRHCSAEFKINFDDGFKDISKGGLAFDYSHISLRRGKGLFVGNSKLYIWGFQSRYLGKTFAIRMKVKINRGAGKYRPEPIISNCGPNGDPSVEIVVHRGKVIFKAKTSDNPEAVFITEDYDDDKWTDLTYYYDGNHFGGSCNGRPFRQRTGGNLEIRDNPMTIGLCTGQNGFHGEIDEVNINHL
ncbi:Shell matrix protein [Mytilus edulis]|uniref:Shell matrix protein n=1 Tax=Mytilus edulis TaxID=6550 RepID=A0A8S3U8V5_MYTED|nr:Shell matrix protein [Mytilus edulis]